MSESKAEIVNSPHGDLKTYIAGFGLSVVLTIFSFVMVVERVWMNSYLLFAIVGAAIIQMFLHLKCFLHLDRSSAQRWNVVVLCFAGLIIFILVFGSLWIMSSAATNMMPMSNMTSGFNM